MGSLIVKGMGSLVGVSTTLDVCHVVAFWSCESKDATELPGPPVVRLELEGVSTEGASDTGTEISCHACEDRSWSRSACTPTGSYYLWATSKCEVWSLYIDVCKIHESQKQECLGTASTWLSDPEADATRWCVRSSACFKLLENVASRPKP